ncbi:Extracytoplasmic solute receptor protein YiaO [Limihaloglobus sulfuriphilus]|uniref:Extracytoplasmic solute receptor protein YiaO n=1 Tax=Limihaloglobus sulfuriphilus TaxID=1851148 RepID=A0A1R7T672_9BACT|nr:TRAP transporter substrate-binding protein [Limihaloglobus sulfuriphilus]AQQ72426.1 Extracytoplasmic solute receptor protein YiaO [Limihaloglobus sulfuriphilus]
MKADVTLKTLVVAMALIIAVCGCKKDDAPAAGEGSDAAPVKAIKLSYANFPPAPTFPCVQMERWKDEVEKRTGGAVEINTYPGGSLLEAKDMMDGVISGQADIGCLCMAYQPGRFVVTNALSLPLGIEDAATGSKALLKLYQQFEPEEFADVKVLAMFTTAPSNIMSKKPVRTAADMKGVNLRASGGAARILEAWGANQVGMPMSETPEALQKGVVEGLFSSLEVMKDFKYADICKYVTMTDTVVYPFAVVMNRQKWQSLPEDVKAVMEDMIEEQSLWTGEYMDEHVNESMEYSTGEQGVEVIELSAQDKAELDAMLAPMVVEWIQQNSAEIDTQAIITAIKEYISSE